MRIWAQSYSRGEVPLSVVEVPLRKEMEGQALDVRPIFLGEPLVALAGAALYHMLSKRVL